MDNLVANEIKAKEELKENKKYFVLLEEKKEINLIKVNTGKVCSEEKKSKIREARKLQITTEETREKMRKAHTGRIHSEETKLKMSKSAKGRIISEEQKEKIREARKKQVIETIQVTCPHCGKTGGNRIMPRYHFNNCKFK